MSKNSSENNDQAYSDLISNNNYDNDDFISFQLDSNTINLYYSQFVKYSKHIRDAYLFSDIIEQIPQEISSIQQKFDIQADSILYFFHLLQQNLNIDENNNEINYKQCVDLFKISNYFEVRKLTYQIKEYIRRRNVDVDFIVQMIQYQDDTINETIGISNEINKEIENILVNKIDECFMNDKFIELPISIIYRIVCQSCNKGLTSDNLYDFIKRSINKLYVLFEFLKLENLSENKFSELCEIYSNSDETTKLHFNYLKCNLLFYQRINESKKKLENQNQGMQKKLAKVETENQEQKGKIAEFESIIGQLKKQLNDCLSENKQFRQQLSDMEKIKIQIEQEKNDLQKKIDEENEKIKGVVTAHVKSGLLINGEINIIFNESGTSLDTSMSKYIISQSNAGTLGIEAYAKGEPITSLKQKTIDCGGKAGTYYIRCIVFGTNGKHKELVSNAVTTSGESITFDYVGKPSQILLTEGKYKLEVWGAKGGNGGGTHPGSVQPGNGGLGGYSTGCINLNKNERLYVYVGGEGQTARMRDGETTNGSFPDGGGTKTGLYSGYTSVPGTGGGSTSIRVSVDSLYSRVIVAGGGGGAGGDCCNTDHGGFGGGLNGGSCCYCGSLKSQGSGTQTGSSCGLGNGSNGDPGTFGLGATGRYIKGHCSGGGGGGGWYGGGSGGHGGGIHCSSGGGGSGWIFIESNFNTWKSNDSSNGGQFILNNSYYLTDATTLAGNEQFPTPTGNGKEIGHSGNGFAKITPK